MPVEWREISSFPNYAVSNEGTVQNEETGRLMTLLVNQAGIVNVGLTKNRIQYKRSVPLLVATEFVASSYGEAFDSVINLNGDRFDNSAPNLVWRPRWFAIKYHKQFEEVHFEDYYPIEDCDTGDRFANPWSASVRFGLLQLDVLLSIVNHSFVWPTKQHFKRIEHADTN